MSRRPARRSSGSAGTPWGGGNAPHHAVSKSTHPAIELRHLRYLVVVIEEGQITRAAQRLHLAQPALSQAISKLERQLGVTLLERRPRGIVPTAAGAAFYEKALAALVAVEEASEALRPWASSESRLRLGSSPVLAPLARPWLRAVIAAHDGAEIETRHLLPEERLVELRRGRIDVELLFPPPDDPSVEHVVVLRSRRYVLLHDTHRLAAEESVRYEQLDDETFPGRHPSIPEDWAEQAFMPRWRGTARTFTREQPTTPDEVWALVAAGRAVAVLPEFMVAASQGDGVRAVPLSDVAPLEVALARRRDDTRTIVEDLFEAAGAGAGDAPAGGVLALSR